MISANLKAFLATIAWSEGTSTNPATKNEGYDVIVSGPDGPELLTTYADHPFAFGRPAKIVRPGPPPLTSSAAGRYQILLRYWQAYKTMLRLPDFTPQSQDAVAIRQIHERGALELIEAGNITQAIRECSPIWASLPYSPYGQPVHSMETLLKVYQAISPQPAAQETA